jgi:hypothetical protein
VDQFSISSIPSLQKPVDRIPKEVREPITHPLAALSNLYCLFDWADGASHSRTKVSDLGQLTREKLNVQSLQIGEEIRRAERDIIKMKQSLQRQSDRGDLASVSQIRSRLAEKEKDLDRLRASDRHIVNEQKQRKSSSKLTVF